MIRAIRKAYGAGFRAGMSHSRIYWKAGARGVKVISEPLNPYRNVFTAPTGNIALALIWESAKHDGMMKRLSKGRL